MKLLRGEFTKTMFQKRTYVGWAGLTAIPIIMALALSLSSKKPGPNEGPPFFSQAVHNGMFLPLAAIAALSFFFLPLVASMAGGFPLAGEAEQGTIKTWLVHPVSRGGVLFSKWVVAVIYVAIGMALVAAVGLAAGGIAFGIHPVVLGLGGTVSVAHGLWLTLLAYLIILAAAVCVVSLAMFFSTLADSSLTAAVGALVVFIVMQILGGFSLFDSIKPYLFTSHLDAWQNLFSRPIVWHPIATALMTFGVYVAVLTVAAWAVFRRKDVLV
jgi:ABC-2 type transport system permease protein